MARETHVGIVDDYLHVTGQVTVACEELGEEKISLNMSSQVTFFDNGKEPEGRPPVRLRQPVKGERIFFELDVAGGSRSSSWGFADVWERIWMIIECRKLGIAA